MPSDQTNSSQWRGLFSESHTVETPEQTNLEFPIAGVGSRFLAFLIDSLIQFGVLIIAAIAIPLLRSAGFMGPLAGAWMLAGLITAAFLLFYGYFILFEIFWNGQTPGKRTLGIRVIKDTGRRLSPIESIGRNLLRIVDQMPGFYGIGIVVALLNRQSKRLGDFVAGSIVVREASVAQIKRSWSNAVPQQTPSAPMGAERLSDEDLILIESFLQRRHELASDIRSRMAADIFRRVESKLTVSVEAQPSFERLLEAVVHQRRAGGNL